MELSNINQQIKIILKNVPILLQTSLTSVSILSPQAQKITCLFWCNGLLQKNKTKLTCKKGTCLSYEGLSLENVQCSVLEDKWHTVL